MESLQVSNFGRDFSCKPMVILLKSSLVRVGALASKKQLVETLARCIKLLYGNSYPMVNNEQGSDLKVATCL